MEVKKQNERRLVLFPAAYQGHMTPMMHLATLLHSNGFSITIIQARYNSVNPTTYPHFTFHFLDDGIPENTVPAPNDYTDILSVLNTNCLEPFTECLGEILKTSCISCLIADPMWDFTASVADSYKLPRMVLRTGSVSTVVVYEYLQVFKHKGYFPLQESRSDEPMLEFPPFKVGDLPPEVQHELIETIVKETKNSQGLICNTFEELELYSIAKARKALSIPIFPIGPLHKYSPASAPSIWTQDQTSISWLNTQAPKSVLYVSFGSLAAISEDEFQEIAWGLANSRLPFLWVVRPGLSEGSKATDLLPEGYLDIVQGRGHIVKWAPQLDVLSHPAVGGFWTHCGWNSTLESICEGVPMLCLPCFADQDMNARHVTDGWKIGIRMGKGMKRDEIERVIRKLMAEKEGEEMRSRVTTLKEKASLCLTKGGSSYKSLESLISYLLSF
ncbi:UDP-glycosyltransferase 76B1-like [Silene latifolia]|uniref:UDP-glycosyltransferase 76B1-like n=1 Tax=Silene latifolia TaxID=37657 RepID=UPI003D783A7B